MKRILIIEDNKELAELIKRWCEGQYEAKIAESEWAVTLQNERPDLVITNYERGCGDRTAIIELSKKIRPACKVLVITGWPDTTELENEVRNEGADSVLFKPFNLNELSVAVKKLLLQ